MSWFLRTSRKVVPDASCSKPPESDWDCSLLQTLGKRCQFEIALGHNGRIWVNGTTLQTTLSICNAILSAENLSAEQIEERCHRPRT
ncbi:hypothetical protein MRX96_011933 [Rhipicephalus microplus]